MTITTDQLTQFRALLKNEEKSAATLNKYLRDIQRFALWLGTGTWKKKKIRYTSATR